MIQQEIKAHIYSRKNLLLSRMPATLKEIKSSQMSRDVELEIVQGRST